MKSNLSSIIALCCCTITACDTTEIIHHLSMPDATQSDAERADSGVKPGDGRVVEDGAPDALAPTDAAESDTGAQRDAGVCGPSPDAGDRWLPMSVAGAPSPRFGAAAAWTGSGMIVTHGTGTLPGDIPGHSILGDGAMYNPCEDRWTRISSDNAPTPRADPLFVWAGGMRGMIVWGGSSGTGPVNNGKIYFPDSDRWEDMIAGNEPSARNAADTNAVWTGCEMIIWSGDGVQSYLDDGAIYNPGICQSTITNRRGWRPMSSSGAPAGRDYFPTVFTDNGLMVAWGGRRLQMPLANGGRYEPRTDTWENVATSPLRARGLPSMVSIRNGKVVIWGGSSLTTTPISLDDGAAYDPGEDIWTQIPSTGRPSARAGHSAVWADDQMIVWGGANNVEALDDGAIYVPDSNGLEGYWAPMSTGNAPSKRHHHVAVWAREVGQMLIYGGRQDVRGAAPAPGGGRYLVAARPPASCDPPAGYVSYWPADGNANDVTGANNGLLVGGRYAPGKHGLAFAFNGTTDYVQIPSSPSLTFNPATQFSILGWINLSSSQRFGDVIGKWGTASGDFGYAVILDQSSDGVNDGKLAFLLDDYGCCRDTLRSVTRVAPNTWYHFAATYDGVTMRIFVNGSMEASRPRSIMGSPPAQPFFIGHSLAGRYFDGLVDEVVVYNRALSASEVMAAYAVCP